MSIHQLFHLLAIPSSGNFQTFGGSTAAFVKFELCL